MSGKIKIHFISLLICFVASCLCSGFLSAQPQNELGTPFIKNYTSKEYKGIPQVFGVTQDANGIVYFTGNGITEYDGKTWRKIPPLGLVTLSIVQGEDGRIYIGGTDDIGFLEPDSLGQQQFISLKHLVPESNRNFGQLRQAVALGNDIYFASKTGYLLKYDSKEKRIRTWKKEPFYALLGTVNEELFLQVPEVGLCKVVGQEIQKIPGGEFFIDIPLTKILPHKEDKILICTKNNGLFLYQNDSFIPFQTEADELINTWIYKAEILPDHSYAFSVIGKGLVVFNQKGEWIYHLKKSNGLQNDIILSIHPSPSGVLWLGSNTGLSQIDLLSPFSNFSTDENNKPLFTEDIIRF